MRATRAAQYVDDVDDDMFTQTTPERTAHKQARAEPASLAGKAAKPAAAKEPPAAEGATEPATVPGAPRNVSPQTGAARDLDLSALDYAEARKLWEGFVTYVRQKKVALGVCLISGTLKSLDDKAVMVGFARGFKFQREQVENHGSKTFLKKMMSRYFGRDLELVCFSEGDEAMAEREKAKVTKGDDEDSVAQRAIEQKPIIKKILDDFDGEIIRYHRR
jgi:hypothetical protein